MYCISFQINPDSARTFDESEFLRRARAIRSPEVDSIEERGKRFLSFNFFTELPEQLWPKLRATLLEGDAFAAGLAATCLVICEGESDDDCRLLHHFDPNQPLDSL